MNPQDITPEQLMLGQTVAIQQHKDGEWEAGQVTALPRPGVVWVAGVGIGLHPEESRIILLEEPTP